MKDPVNHPPHYMRGKIEAISVIEDWQLGYHLGNTLKYLCRAGLKDPDRELEDLHKAQWYLNRYVKAREDGKATRKVGTRAGLPKGRQRG